MLSEAAREAPAVDERARRGAPRAIPLALRPAALLGLGARLAPPGLLSEASAAHLARLPAEFPPVAGVGAFEVRLGSEGAPVDYEVCLRASARVREALASALGGAGGEALGARSPGWARAVRFLRAWARPGSALPAAVPIVWLEFDAGAGEPEPFVVLTLDRERFHPGGVGDRALLARFLVQTLGLMGDLDREMQRTLHGCIAGLPPAAQFAHAALRPGPGGDALRLVVRLPGENLPESLVRLGWPGSSSRLRGLLDRLFTTRAVHPVNLDLGAGLGPRLGLEFHHPTPPRSDPRWRRFLDGLEAEGACCRVQRRRLEAWGEVLPPAPLHLERDLLVKVVIAPDGPLHAKAYLPFAAQLRAGGSMLRGEPTRRSRARTWRPRRGAR